MKMKALIISGATIAVAGGLTFGGLALAEQQTYVAPTVEPSPSVIDPSPTVQTTPEPTVTTTPEPTATTVPAIPLPAAPTPTAEPTITPPPNFGNDTPMPAVPGPVTPPPTAQPREP